MRRILQYFLTTFTFILFSSFSLILWINEGSSLILEPKEKHSEFILDENSNILIKPYSNVHGHVYPYTASVVTCGCIVTVLVIIIVCAPNLGD